MALSKKLEDRFGDRVSQQGFLTYAEKYYHAFQELARNSQGTADYYPVDYYLASHSIELSLKSALRKNNYSLDLLASKKFGHNLQSLTSEVANNRFLLITDGEFEIISRVNKYYLFKQFEYIVRGAKDLPNDSDLDFVALDLLEKARQLI